MQTLHIHCPWLAPPIIEVDLRRNFVCIMRVYECTHNERSSPHSSGRVTQCALILMLVVRRRHTRSRTNAPKKGTKWQIMGSKEMPANLLVFSEFPEYIIGFATNFFSYFLLLAVCHDVLGQGFTNQLDFVLETRLSYRKVWETFINWKCMNIENAPRPNRINMNHRSAYVACGMASVDVNRSDDFVALKCCCCWNSSDLCGYV